MKLEPKLLGSGCIGQGKIVCQPNDWLTVIVMFNSLVGSVTVYKGRLMNHKSEEQEVAVKGRFSNLYQSCCFPIIALENCILIS